MFTGHEDQEVSFEDGAVLTARWREENPGAKKGGYFSRDSINELLAQDDCVGIRIYYALNGSGEMAMVVVGVTSDENDQIGEEFVCIDNDFACPPYCADDNILNSDE